MNTSAVRQIRILQAIPKYRRQMGRVLGFPGTPTVVIDRPKSVERANQLLDEGLSAAVLELTLQSLTRDGPR